MPRIPLPKGLIGDKNQPRTRQSLTNLFNTGAGTIISRPGITGLTTTGRVARGQFVWSGGLYQVVSEDLIQITNTTTGANTNIGTIAGNAVIDTAIGFNEAVILVKGGSIYTLDTANTLTLISGNANFVPCDAVAHIDGRFVYIPTDGSPAFFSDVGDAGTVQAASFFDAEELPDKNTTVFNLRNTLYIGGTDSFELFRNTGASPNPFARLTGARIDYGFIGGLAAYADTFYFIGRERDQDFGIYAIGQGRAEKVSNEAIDNILSEYTPMARSLAIPNRFKWRGYDLLTFALADDAFGFFNGNWFVLTSTNADGDPVVWNGGFIDQFEGAYYTAFEDNIGRLDEINTDYGLDIQRIIDLSFEQPDNEFFACQSLDLGVSQGFNAAVGTVGLAMSRNNVEYGEFIFRDLGAQGQYTQHLEWNEPGGLGAYDGFMGMRIFTTQDVIFGANALSAYFRG